MVSKRGTPQVPVEPTFPKVYETFREPHSSQFTDTKPSAFNGIVMVYRYRVTVERIDESAEVIRQRITDLWENCTNCHQWSPLRAAAAKVGLTLDIKNAGKRLRVAPAAKPIAPPVVPNLGGPWVEPKTLAETAKRIDAHLKRFELDLTLNALDPTYKTRPYSSANASVAGRFCSVVYVSYHTHNSLKKDRAVAYLRWLDAGNVGKHFDCERKT